MLHVTNGDIAASLLKEAQLPGDVIAWIDALHEGPVFPNLLLAEESIRRAEFIASRGWSSHEEARRLLEERDTRFLAARSADEIVLWFEADLYDQLQLLQILNTLALTGTGTARISMVCIGDYPGMDRFVGFGQLSARHMAGLFPNRVEVTAAQLTLGMQAWKAFTGNDPAIIETLARKTSLALPFLSDALKRFLEEFPETASGLSRTEHQILRILDRGVSEPRRLFKMCQDLEERPYLGDTIFWEQLTALLDGGRPLVRTTGPHPFAVPTGTVGNYKDPVLVLTPDAHDVLAGRKDWMELHGVDRWFGGLHMVGRKPLWRWDVEKKHLVKQL